MEHLTSEKIELISEIGLALHRYGTNAYRLEDNLKDLSSALGIEGQFFSTPTYLAMSLSWYYEGKKRETTKHLRVQPGEVNLNKLQLLDTLAKKICDNRIETQQALQELDRIENHSMSYPKTIVVLAFALTSLAISVLLNGSYYDNLIALFLGGIVGFVHFLSTKYKSLLEVFEFVAAMLVTLFCYLVFNLIKPFNFQLVLISSLIVIIPGLSFTTSMVELATKNLASGTARIMGSLVDLLKISFGIYLGLELSHLFFFPIDYIGATNEAIWALPLSVLIAGASFTVIFNARKSDFIWILYSGVISISSLTIAAHFFEQVFASFLAALVVTLGSNLFARITKRPAVIVLLPGIIFLVPGSIGLKGLNFLMRQEILSGFSSGVQMFSVAISIVAGLFFANLILPPRERSYE